jgi:GT2 family glycosyltransferase
MKKIDLSIVILNYNTPKLLDDCVDSIFKFIGKIPFEVIIVDNASDSKSTPILKKLAKNPKITMVYNKKNEGFAKGNNMGINLAQGKYVLLLNSDTKVHSDTLPGTLSFISKNANVGIVSCALLSDDGSLQLNGGYFPSIPRIFSWMFFLDDIPILNKLLLPYHIKSQKKIELDWVTGAFLLIRNEVIKSIGVLDTKYFMYVEDMDYCYRAKKSGWKVFYLGDFAITHFGGASSERAYPLISEVKGVLTFYSKYFPIWEQRTVYLIFKLGMYIRMLLFRIIKGRETSKIYEEVLRQI